MKNYYNELEIPESATQAEIKKAYRQLALIHHPDKNAGSKEAEEKFKALNEAHEALTDNDRRIQHDQALAEFRRQEKLRREQERHYSEQQATGANNQSKAQGAHQTGNAQPGQGFNVGYIIMAVVAFIIVTALLAGLSSSDKPFPGNPVS